MCEIFFRNFHICFRLKGGKTATTIRGGLRVLRQKRKYPSESNLADNIKVQFASNFFAIRVADWRTREATSVHISSFMSEMSPYPPPFASYIKFIPPRPPISPKLPPTYLTDTLVVHKTTGPAKPQSAPHKRFGFAHLKHIMTSCEIYPELNRTTCIYV